MKITAVRAIETAPQPGCNLLIVKIETDQPGLCGLGCATFTQRYKAVTTAIEEYMAPLLLGRDPLAVEELWQVMMNSSYWRNGPVLGNAISGCDMALWDILGKEAGMPVYQLWGGKQRPAAAIYRHAGGETPEEVAEDVLRFMAKGVQHIRCQIGGYGGKNRYLLSPEGAADGAYFDPAAYMRGVPAMLEAVRRAAGEEVELLHDVHERLSPVETIRLARSVEPYRLFFLEDSLPPEQGHWFEQLRAAAAVPLAMGELFNNPMEILPLVQNRWVDFIRCHVSQIGGVTPARRLANLCDAFGIRTAWHGPGDVSPVGHVANLHLDLTLPNFGIQEWCGFEEDERIQEVFTGLPWVRAGYAYCNDKPGWGIDIDETAARRYPCDPTQPGWLLARLPDGSSARA